MNFVYNFCIVIITSSSTFVEYKPFMHQISMRESAQLGTYWCVMLFILTIEYRSRPYKNWGRYGPSQRKKKDTGKFSQHIAIGGKIVHTVMLPQGSGISVPGSIMNAAYQRWLKFENQNIPSDILHLMLMYSAIYVDDSLT